MISAPDTAEGWEQLSEQVHDNPDLLLEADADVIEEMFWEVYYETGKDKEYIIKIIKGNTVAAEYFRNTATSGSDPYGYLCIYYRAFPEELETDEEILECYVSDDPLMIVLLEERGLFTTKLFTDALEQMMNDGKNNTIKEHLTTAEKCVAFIQNDWMAYVDLYPYIPEQFLDNIDVWAHLLVSHERYISICLKNLATGQRLMNIMISAPRRWVC